LRSQLCRCQQKPEDLWISLRRPACGEIEQEEHQHSPGQAVEEIERRSSKAHGEEKQFSLRAEDGERT
jgi:hypothetical protein